MPDWRGRPLWCSQTVQHFRQRARSKRKSFGQAIVSPALVSLGVAHEPLTRLRPPDSAPPRTESWCPIGGGGLGGGDGLLSPPLGGFLSLMA